MTQINLLPWREQTRKAQKIRLAMVVAGFVLFTLFLVFTVHVYYSGLIRHQKSRTVFLESQVAKETKVLADLNKKKEEMDKVIAELDFLISLRDQSYQVVRMLDELVRMVPEGVKLIKIVRTKDKMLILGKAQSEVEVTLFMKNFIKSTAFNQPELTEINSKQNATSNETIFQMEIEPKKQGQP